MWRIGHLKRLLTQHRAQTFYTIFSCKLITDLLSPQIASASMSHSLWLPYLLCEIALLLALLVLLSTPETLPAKEQSQYADDHSSSDSESAVRTWMRLLSDWRILLGVLITFLCQFRFSLIQILLPYISVRFDAWTISRVSTSRRSSGSSNNARLLHCSLLSMGQISFYSSFYRGSHQPC